MATPQYTSSPSVTVRLAADGKNWKDWIKQITNYAATENATAVFDGDARPQFDPTNSKYALQSLIKPDLSLPNMSPNDIAQEIEKAGKLNVHIRPLNDDARRLKKDDEDRLNACVSRDAKFQNTILSSIDKALIPQVRGCDTANAMYRVLKELNNTSDHASAAAAWHAFIDLRADTCKSVRDYIGKFREAITDLATQGIVKGWKKPSIMATTTAEAGLDELIVIHLLYGLSKVLQAWIEPRNNDLRQGNTWTVDTLIQSIEDHLRHVNEEPVKTFASFTSRRRSSASLAASTTTATPLPRPSSSQQRLRRRRR